MMKDFSLKCAADYSCQSQPQEKWWEVEKWGAINNESVKVEISNQSGCYLRPRLRLKAESEIPNKLVGWTGKMMWQVSNTRKQSTYWQTNLADELRSPEWQEVDYLSPDESSEYQLRIYNTETLKTEDVDTLGLRFSLEWAFDFEYCPTEGKVEKEIMVVENGIIELTKGSTATTILRADGNSETQIAKKPVKKQSVTEEKTQMDKIVPVRTARKFLEITEPTETQTANNYSQTLRGEILANWWLWLIILFVLIILGIGAGWWQFFKANKTNQKESI